MAQTCTGSSSSFLTGSKSFSGIEQIVPARPGRREITLYVQTGNFSVYDSPTGNAMEIKDGAQITLRTEAAVYGSGSTVQWVEVYD